jgi:pimeloyl-ACP methyl ester carboxylesterase
MTRILCVLLAAGAGASCLPPEWGAEAALRPERREVKARPGVPGEDVVFAGVDRVILRGWKALDAACHDRVVLFGGSLGAAVALQAAPLDPRIRVAQSSFSSLVEIAQERAPWFATAREVDRALALAAARGGFALADASPVEAARHIRVPVLLIHGQADRERRPEHSRRIEMALRGQGRLLLVPGAGHADTLRGDAAWSGIEGFLAALDPER